MGWLLTRVGLALGRPPHRVGPRHGVLRAAALWHSLDVHGAILPASALFQERVFSFSGTTFLHGHAASIS